MPQTDVLFYQQSEGDVPVLDWLRELDGKNRRAANKCQAAIERLAELGPMNCVAPKRTCSATGSTSCGSASAV